MIVISSAQPPSRCATPVSPTTRSSRRWAGPTLDTSMVTHGGPPSVARIPTRPPWQSSATACTAGGAVPSSSSTIARSSGRSPDGIHVADGVSARDTAQVHRRDPPQLARARHVPQLLDARVIAPLVEHEEPAVMAVDQPLGLRYVRRDRLLHRDRHVLGGQERLDDLQMRANRGAHHRAAHRRQIGHRGHDARGAAGPRPLGALRRVGDCPDLAAEGPQVPQDERAPRADAGEGDRRSGGDRGRGHTPLPADGPLA
jgi:hypothetical protein